MKKNSSNSGLQIRVYLKIIIFNSQPKHVMGIQKNRLNETRFFSTQHTFKLMGKKIITISG